MTESTNSDSPVWHMIHELHKDRERALVNATKATVIFDDRNPTPYEIGGEVVGHVVTIDDEGFVLAGYSFRTRVLWSDALAAMPRGMAA